MRRYQDGSSCNILADSYIRAVPPFPACQLLVNAVLVQVDFGLPAKPNPQQFHLLFLFLQPQINASSNLLRYRHPVTLKQGAQSFQLIVLKPDPRSAADRVFLGEYFGCRRVTIKHGNIAHPRFSF
jgi:hypothetical protein